MGGSKKQTIGYAYYMGLHMVVAKSADALIEIIAGERTIWKGENWHTPYPVEQGHFKHPYGDSSGIWNTSVLWRKLQPPIGNVTSNRQILINAPNVFGGQEKEGGIVGSLDVMFGGADQGVNDYLLRVQGAPQPAYRGVFSLVFRGGIVTAMTPYLKPWQFRIRRNRAQWEGGVWYPEAVDIDVGNGIVCMNPAHMMYQVMTDSEDGMGYPRGTLDDAAFRKLADTCKAEALGLKAQWVKSDTIEKFLEQVCDHANVMVSQDPVTSLFRPIALRADYDPATLLELNPSNAELEMWDRSTPEETLNEITVQWDESSTGKEGSVTVQSLAMIQAIGGVVNQTKTYAMCPTAAIARRLAQRDCDIASALLARCRITATRVAAHIIPGDVIRLAGFDKLDLVSSVIRVLKVRYGGPNGQTVTIEGAEDVFGLPLASYLGDPPAGWVDPPTSPQPSTAIEAIEMPYRDLVRDGGQDAVNMMDPAAGYVGAVALRPAGVPQSFEMGTRATSSGDYAFADGGDFSPSGTLATGVGQTETVLSLASVSSWAEAEPGSVAMIGPFPGSELVRVDQITGNVLTVTRGVMDTVPQAWAAGTRLFLYDDDIAIDTTEYAAGEVVNVVVATLAAEGSTSVEESPKDSVTLNRRAARPYPAAALRVAGSMGAEDRWDALSAAWNHRNRIVQADTLVGYTAASITPEAGTTYTAVWRLNDAVVKTTAGLTSPADTYTPPQGSGGAAMTLTVTAMRDGLASWQSPILSFTYRAYEITETGDQIVTESGDPIILE